MCAIAGLHAGGKSCGSANLPAVVQISCSLRRTLSTSWPSSGSRGSRACRMLPSSRPCILAATALLAGRWAAPSTVALRHLDVAHHMGRLTSKPVLICYVLVRSSILKSGCLHFWAFQYCFALLPCTMHAKIVCSACPSSPSGSACRYMSQVLPYAEPLNIHWALRMIHVCACLGAFMGCTDVCRRPLTCWLS